MGNIKINARELRMLIEKTDMSPEAREAQRRGFKRPAYAELDDGSLFVFDLANPIGSPFQYVGGTDDPFNDLVIRSL